MPQPLGKVLSPPSSSFVMDFISCKTTMAIVAVVLALAIRLIWVYLMSDTHDPREPPLIPSPIPYVGHLLELLKIGSFYYTALRLGHVFKKHYREQDDLSLTLILERSFRFQYIPFTCRGRGYISSTRRIL